MDNVSRISQVNTYDTAIDESISLYLSFNSSMADKTVEADDYFFERDEERENRSTVIKKNVEMTPMRKAPKSILQEINVFSSTPTKGGVDQIQMGMAALGLAPLEEVHNPMAHTQNSARNENSITICEKSLEIANGKQIVGEDCDGDETIEDKSQNIVTVNSSSDTSNVPSIIVIEIESDNSLEGSMNEKTSERKALSEANETKKEIVDETNKDHSLQEVVVPMEENKENICVEYEETICEGKENICGESLTVRSYENKRYSGALPKAKKKTSLGTRDINEAPQGKCLSTARLEESMNKKASGRKIQPDANDSKKEIVDERNREHALQEVIAPMEENKENICEEKENICGESITVTNNVNKRYSGAIPKAKKKSSLGTSDNIREAPSGKRLSTARLRKSILPCEPDLNLNRPSRIEGNKRLSTTNCKRSSIQLTTCIPRLFVNSVGIPRHPAKPGTSQEKVDEPKKTTLSRKSMIPPPPKPKVQGLQKRQTIFAPANKRLSVIKQKMSAIRELSPKGLPKKSGILKTTLNNSASRRSIRKTLYVPVVNTNPKQSRISVLPPPVSAQNSIKARSKSPNEIKKQITDSKKLQQGKSAAPSSNEVFSCDKCPRNFRLLSSLEAHKAIHGVTTTTAPMCKFCDKKFAIPKALTNHLLEKCTKIPSAERKKLLFPPTPSQEKRALKSNSSTIPNKSGINEEHGHPSTCSVNSVVSETTPPDSKEMLPPTSSTKSKCKIPPAHSGVYSTPSKPVVCYPCRKNFDHVLGFTEHVMSYHSGSDVDS